MEIVFSFDRDGTVSTGEPPGPIPITWVRELARLHTVYAHGNQNLTEEAGIPGVVDLRALIDDDSWGGNAEIYEDRIARVGMVKDIYPYADRYICVDDVDISELELEGWEYYSPEEFLPVFDSLNVVRWEGLPPRDVAPFVELHAEPINAPVVVDEAPSYANGTVVAVHGVGAWVIEGRTRRAIPNHRTQQWLRGRGAPFVQVSREDAASFLRAFPEGPTYGSKAVGGGWE